MVLPTIITQPGTSLRSLVGAFIITKLTEGKSDRTVESYSENLKRFIWYAESQNWPQNIHEITQWHIKAFLGYVALEKDRWGLEGNGSETSQNRASQATVLHYYNILKLFYNWLMEEKILAENFMDRIHVAKPPLPLIEPYSREDINRMLKICDYDFEHYGGFLGSRNRAIILVLLDTGLRLSEFLAMKLGDINPDNGQIKVVGKGRRKRVVRVGKTARSAVDQYLSYRPDNGRRELWLSEWSKPLSRDALQCLVKRLKRRAGVDSRGSVHRFRHTFAVEFLRADHNVFNLQYLLGHSELEMVRRYTRALGMEDALAAHEQASPADMLGYT
jgi:site-specific recombinase XerD